MSVSTIAVVAVVAVGVLLLLLRRGNPRRIGLDPKHAETARQRMEQASVGLSAADAAEVADLMAKGRKIEAIKLVREKTGLGLKEAKEFVEHHASGAGR